MKLYEIESNLEILANEISAIQDEEIPEEEKIKAISLLRNEFNQNTERKKDKLLNLGKLVKNYKAELKAYKDEMKRLKKNSKALKNKIARTTEFIALFINEDEKLEDSQVKISYRTSHRLHIDDDAFIPVEYRKTPVWKPDKKSLKKDLKSGKKFSGIFIEDHHNLQIK